MAPHHVDTSTFRRVEGPPACALPDEGRAFPHAIGPPHMDGCHHRSSERRGDLNQAAPECRNGTRASAQGRQRPRPGIRGPAREVSDPAQTATSWMLMPRLLHELLSASRTNLSSFLRSSCKRMGRSALSAELLPCPLPYPWIQTSQSRGSRRQQRRFKEQRALDILVNLHVVSLNFMSWVCLGPLQ